MHDAACLAVARRAVSLQSVYLLGALCRGLHDPLLLVQVEEKEEPIPKVASSSDLPPQAPLLKQVSNPAGASTGRRVASCSRALWARR
jgi:hypothetical protein